MKFPRKLLQKLEDRKDNQSLRVLQLQDSKVDFASNDYLGFAKDAALFDQVHVALRREGMLHNGSGGSRLLTGNTEFVEKLESQIANVHKMDAALLFNSGYTANIGFCQAVFQRGDVVLYDSFCHASIRDGIQLGRAKAYKFAHNCLESLKELLTRFSSQADTIYVYTESVFSMDGDQPDLPAMVALCKEFGALLVVDEAHGLGVSPSGRGWVYDLQLQTDVFASIVTYGKALGCHGAAVLGSRALRTYMINFSRSFIYTTAISMHSAMTIKLAYEKLLSGLQTKVLFKNILYFKHEMGQMGLVSLFIPSNSAIQACVIPGNDRVKALALYLHQNQIDVRPILSPTVSVGQERLRICLHSYNSKSEIRKLQEKIQLWQQASPESTGC
ncbi:MAG: aminotransferase class I/II-fold pyridoxal phosphate-dependent enzyme [Flavobacteriaceae bacterium]|nr:aminotransferase class I/II-fold pyridoxal phosphate-dependent enzyme [Flavobacteriaceae bacterium]